MRFKVGDIIYLMSTKKHQDELRNWSKVDGLKKGVPLTVTDLQGIDDAFPWIRVTPSRKGILHNPEKFKHEKA